MFKIIVFLFSILFTLNFAYADKVLVFEFTKKELKELKVRKVRGADNTTEFSVGSNENGNFLKALADNGLQIHGGNGFALEYKISRILCDARILNIFEGAAEIQAQVIARRLLET